VSRVLVVPVVPSGSPGTVAVDTMTLIRRLEVGGVSSSGGGGSSVISVATETPIRSGQLPRRVRLLRMVRISCLYRSLSRRTVRVVVQAFRKLLPRGVTVRFVSSVRPFPVTPAIRSARGLPTLMFVFPHRLCAASVMKAEASNAERLATAARGPSFYAA
jgi:hypothetical protein